jgi:hypothetical protein
VLRWREEPHLAGRVGGDVDRRGLTDLAYERDLEPILVVG